MVLKDDKDNEKAQKSLIIALDCETKKAISLVETLHDAGIFPLFKEGFADFASLSANLDNPEILGDYQRLHELIGKDVLKDLKIHDIKNTAQRAVEAFANSKCPPAWLNMHCSMGQEGCSVIVKNRGEISIAGVSILTSLDDAMCIEIYGDTVKEKVLQFARLLVAIGAQGIICSAQELEMLNEHPEFNALQKITPGIQKTSVKTDQKRVMTVEEAIRAGSSKLVIGRQIVESPDPVAETKNVIQQIQEAREALYLRSGCE